MTIRFTYNGKVRIVEVQKETATYVQGYNRHSDAKTKGATYSRDKMIDVEQLFDEDEGAKYRQECLPGGLRYC